MNTNPSLLLGLAEQYLKKSGIELHRVEEHDIELRVYAPEGAGFWFVRGSGAGRWYYKDDAGADHFNRADEAELQAAIALGARVQVVGYHSRPLATWRTWAEFEAAVGG